MQASELLTNLRQQGFTLTPLPDGKLEVKPASKLTDSLREALKRQKAEVLALLQQQESPAPLDYRQLYHQAAEAVREDCFSIDPCWLRDRRPDLWEQIRDLDENLTAMERMGASEPAYHATLIRLVRCIQDARALCEREREQSAEKAMQ